MAGSERHFGLDLLRAWAILGVLALHAGLTRPDLPPRLLFLTQYGWVGVDLFFVLSGFLIASQVMDAGELPRWEGVRRFWARRWTRTLPLYFVVLAGYALLKPVLFHAPFHGSWRFLVFLQNTAPLPDFVQSWSLCIEEQFYFLFPLIYYVLRPRRAAWWLVPLAISVALRVQAWHALGLPAAVSLSYDPATVDAVFRFSTLRHLDGIAVGVFLAATRARWRCWAPAARVAGSGVAVALLAATPLLFSATPGGGGVVMIFLWLAVLFGAMLVGADVWSVGPPGGAVVERIAVWSYGAYLWNNVLMRLLPRWLPGVPWPAGVALYFGGTLGIAALTYAVIEKPGMRLRRYFLPARPAAVAAPPAAPRAI